MTERTDSMDGKRALVHISYIKKYEAWCIRVNGRLMDYHFRTQRDAFYYARRYVLTLLAWPQAISSASIYIHTKKTGRIREERTYPRIADPHPPKG